MRERERVGVPSALRFWTLAGGAQAQFPQRSKMPRVCFGHACNKKGVASLVGAHWRKGLCANWVSDVPHRVGLACGGGGWSAFLWHAHLCWLHSPLLGLAHSPCLSHSMRSCRWKCSYSTSTVLRRTPHPATHPTPHPCPLPRAAATCLHIDVGYCYSPCAVINVGHKLVWDLNGAKMRRVGRCNGRNGHTENNNHWCKK